MASRNIFKKKNKTTAMLALLFLFNALTAGVFGYVNYKENIILFIIFSALTAVDAIIFLFAAWCFFTERTFGQKRRVKPDSKSVKWEQEMRDAVSSAEETSRFKSMFLANMSHEIRTPLNGIAGLSELALAGGGLSEKTADYFTKIKTSALGLLAIVNDILDITKIEAGKTELENIVFSFGDVFRSCETVIGLKDKSKKVKLVFDYAELAGEKAVGDPTKLNQILMNLLSNAIKFTSAGVVELKTKITEKTDDTLTVYFSVQDTGIGMDGEQIKKVLEPFSQADASITRKYGGTGLGLSITGNLLEIMNSKLIIESEKGKGSRFSFTLQFPREKPADITSAKKSGELAGGVIKIGGKKPIFEAQALVCEDNAINRQVISEHLRRVGITPIIAENGKIGVNMVKMRMRSGKPFDIILMDVHMPVMDGLEATEKLVEAGSETPVIAITANVTEEDKKLFFKTGMSDSISKPFSSRDLWDCLLNHLIPVRFVEINADGATYNKDEIIDGAAGLEKAAGDPALYKKIKIDFYLENSDTIANIEKAVGAGDFKTAFRMAHTLKGVATLIGATPLSEAAFAFENVCKEGKTDTDALSLLSQRLSAVLEALKPEARMEIEAEEKISGAGTDIKRALEIIRQLEPLLSDGSSEATDFVYEIKSAFSKELSKDFLTYLLDYEFDAAMEEIQRIKKQLEAEEQ